MGMRAAVLVVVCVWAGVTGCDSATHAQVGTPCIPSSESDPTFLGHDPQFLEVDPPGYAGVDGAIVCLVDHFRGRVGCPYGQDATGTQLPAVDGASGGPFPPGVGPCVTPTGASVTGEVEPQCADRREADVVYWSCRCSNAAGMTNDGNSYCTCPSDMVCGADPCVGLDDCVMLGMCRRQAAAYSMVTACATPCDPSTTTCR